MKKNQTLQKDLANYIEWEGPFVFIINNQRLFIDFSAPKHYNIGINSQDIHEIINISAKNVSEIEMCRPNGQFLDLSFLYGPEIIGQNVRDIHTVVDDKSVISSLSSVIIELQNNFCLVISEEIDNPMLRIYANIKEALEAIDKLK